MTTLDLLFEPRSVALVGASSDPDKLSGRPVRFLRDAGFAGRVHLVNPGASEVQGRPTVPSIDAIEGEVDQAIVVVPVAAVQAAVEACARKGIRLVQVFSAGFADVGAEGLKRQLQLQAFAREQGVRLLGPNCLGVVSVHNRFFATFSTALEALTPQAGGIAFATQSGAFGSCAYAMAIQRGLGISRIVATGNEVDIDVAECIAWFADDPKTRVVCAALEGCHDGARLRAALVKCARAGKPVVIMKVGASEVGAAAAATHTGSLAGNDAVFNAVFAECGAHRARSIEEMLDVAQLCAVSPLPRTRELGVVTLSGGVGVLMADAAEPLGLTLPPLPSKAAEAVAEIVPFATLGNPLDTTAQIAAVKSGMSRVLGTALAHTDWGAVLVYLAQRACAPARFAPLHAELRELRAAHPDRCIVLVGPSDESIRRELEADGLPMFSDPTRAVVAVAAAAFMRAQAGQLHAPLATGSAQPLPPVHGEAAAKQLLADAGLPVLPERLCATADAAADAAATLGYPVVLKLASRDIAHKTEVGGVLLHLRDAAAVRSAFDTIVRRAREAMPTARIDGVLVAPMVTDGVETILGAHHDEVFGPMVMFGLGGVAVELFRDVAFASAPLTRPRAQALVDSVRASALLRGYRGQSKLDVDALVDALCRLSDFAARHAGALQSVDINPFVVRPQGGVCLDALITLRGLRPA
jgi:acetate---CoA ligase (ADP-forming)